MNHALRPSPRCMAVVICARRNIPHSTRIDEPEFYEIWQQYFEPSSLVQQQRAPVCYISGSNDFFGICEHGNEVLNQLSVPHRRAWLPNCDHAVSVGASKLVSAFWMRHYLLGEAGTTSRTNAYMPIGPSSWTKQNMSNKKSGGPRCRRARRLCVVARPTANGLRTSRRLCSGTL